jgi:hypothetical protein
MYQKKAGFRDYIRQEGETHKNIFVRKGIAVVEH